MKNKANFHTKIISGFYVFIRGGALWLSLLLIFLLMINSVRLAQKIKQYNGYSELNGYYGIRISPNIDSSDAEMQKLDDALITFFKSTNGEQSRLFSVGNQVELYNDGFISQEDLDFKDYTVTVNETYLMEHPVYDINGTAVEITGNPNEDYLLIPDNLKNMEDDIRQYYQENNTFLRYYIDDVKEFGIEAAHKQEHTPVPLNIIYIRNHQRHNIYNLPNGKLNGVIEDAIISVITTENVSTAQIPHYITNQDYMIHITNAEQQILFEQALESSGLSDFVMQVYSLSNDFFHEVKKNIGFLLVQIALLFIIQIGIYITDKRFFHYTNFCLTIRIIIISWLIALGMFIFIQKQLSITVIESALVAVIIEIFRINVVANRTKS